MLSLGKARPHKPMFLKVCGSWSQWFLVPLNGREQRCSVESRRLGEIASEAEELLLFHTKLPMVRAAFPVWRDRKVGKKVAHTTFLSQASPSNVSAAERTRGWHRASHLANADAWMFIEPQFYTAAFLFPDCFQKAGAAAAFWYSSAILLRYPDMVVPQTFGDTGGMWIALPKPAFFTLHAVTVCKNEKIKPE